MSDLATSVSPESRPDPVLAEAPHRIGTVTLVVHDLEQLSRFYQEVIGLALLQRDETVAVLGAGAVPLLTLRKDLAARRWSPREAGLFHTAFLLPSRADLGAWLRSTAERRIPVSGASDHIVSEAVYLNDPEGNGIEIYADRPSAGWSWQQGSVAISTERLDVEGVIAAATGPWSGMPQGGSVGHVHLQAGDLARSQVFYVDLLGFDITARYPGALFLGSGGYHHQLATNIWNSRGAPPRTEPTTGLAEVEIRLRNRDILAATRARLAEGGVAFEEGEAGLSVKDPWGTGLRLVPAA
jgi:catechol 2,3-dioxygenase